MVTCQSSELGWEVTLELPADFLSLGRGSVIFIEALVATSFLYSNFLCGFINSSKSRPLIGVATSASVLNNFFHLNHIFLVATSLTGLGDVVT